jgi:tetrapyrrole methylase family protein/MazG family protein/ATP diphosphatase
VTDDLEAEKAAKGGGSLLDDVPVGLPGLTRAVKLSKRAAGVGFVWPTVQDVVKKLHEEVGEMLAEIEAGDLEKAKNEIGDVLFVVANLARTLDVDPEDAVRYTNAKFVRRFKYIEAKLAERGKTPDQSDLAEMDALWEEVKAGERAGTL